MSSWVKKAAEEIAQDDDVMPWSPNDITINVARVAEIIKSHCPIEEPREPPLLQCVDCKNTESPAGAMARQFNRGRCLHCGGWFKVIRA